MKRIKPRLKLIFAFCTLFFASLFCGVFALNAGNAAAEGGNNYMKYPANTKVGYCAEYLGTVERKVPEEGNEGIADKFPVYGTVLYEKGGHNREKQNLLQENGRLLSEGLSGIVNCTYDSMDGEGNLYLAGERAEGRTLYKHTASKGMYYGDVSDGEERIIKRISYNSRGFGNHLTGLYAPAGEVISITMSKADFEACGGLKMYVGQVLSNDGAREDIPNNISSSRAFNRMPFTVNAMSITSDTSTLVTDDEAGTVTGYFGSFLGGPVYLRPLKGGSRFTVTISGGVRYRHFILGYTTESEFNENAKSSAPYFDLEIWDGGVRHSGPLAGVSDYTYKQLYDAAVFWEKVASVSAQVRSNVNAQGIVDMLYDCFIGTGGATNSVVCDEQLFAGALGYTEISKNGCYGALKEYFKLFRSGWGFTGLGEDAGEALVLLTHSLFTDASSARNSANVKEASDINDYLDAAFSLGELKKGAKSLLPAYAVILHSFGQDAFLKAAGLGYGSGNDNWFRALVDATGHDMTYFFTSLCRLNVSKKTLDWAASLKYPVFVPLACSYQTGEVYTADGERTLAETMRPYAIEKNEPLKIDFDKTVQLPSGFSYRIEKISPPERGAIQKMTAHEYVYTPDPSPEEAAKCSGRIYVRISVKKDDGKFEAEDKILILRFVQKQTKPHTLVRCDYSYGAENMYTDAKEAFEENFAGFAAKVMSDNTGLNMPEGGACLAAYGRNVVSELTGKIYVQASGKYRVGLKGEGNSALFLSSNGKDYTPAAVCAGAEYFQSEGAYCDLELTAGSWLYFKQVLICKEEAWSAMGMGKFEGNGVVLEDVKGAYRANYVAESAQIFVGDNPYKDLKNKESLVKSFGAGSLINCNFDGENGFGAENIFDGNENTYFFSGESEVTAETPFVLTVDLGEEVYANRASIICTYDKKFLPKAFKIEAGARLDDMRVIIDRGGLPVQAGGVVSASFTETKMRYYKLTVTDTYAKDNGHGSAALALSGIEFGATYTGFTRVSPDDGRITYSEGFAPLNTLSAFGHLNEGAETSRADFNFYGSQFAVYSLFGADYGTYEIYVDGTLAGEVDLSGGEGVSAAFLSERLEEGRHEVSLRGKSGKFNIESLSVKPCADPLAQITIPELKPDGDSQTEDYRKPDDLKGEDNKPSGGDGVKDGGLTGWQAGLIIIAGTVAVCAAAVIATYFVTKRKRGV